MSLSYSSECFSDLLCCEDAGILTDDLPEYSSPPGIEFPEDIKEAIAGLIDEERDFVAGFEYSHSVDASARDNAIAWILKVHAFYLFQPLTAYLSVNYLDRFLSSRRLPQSKGWPMQLLSVTCLSLAAKMEEPLVPSLFDIQVGDAKFIFEPRTIRRMELLVLTVLDWRLRSITPFNFIGFFASKVDSTGLLTRPLVSRATQIILSTIKEVTFINYCPSATAAATILFAANEILNLSNVDPEDVLAWCIGLNKEKILSCYKLMQEVVVDDSPKTPPPFLPQTRIHTRSDSSSSSTSSSNKRQKLNNWPRATDLKTNLE